MAYTGFTQTNPSALPRTIDPSASLAEINPLPPPGRPLDGTSDLHPHRTGHYAAVKHTITLTLTGSWATDDTLVVTITPVLTGQGVAAADAFSAITVSTAVAATETATGAAAAIVTAAAASGAVTALADVGSESRLREICLVTNEAGVVTFTAVNPGATFTVAFSTDGSGADAIATSVDAAQSNLRVGIFVAQDGVADDGFTPKVRLLASGDVEADVYGIVADGDRAVAIDPEAGYTYRGYRPGRDVPIIPLDGAWVAYAEAAVDIMDTIYVRAVATGSEVAGAANDTPDIAAQVVTVTPTATNDANYAGYVQVYDEDGKVVAVSAFNYTADASATATEIVTGIDSDLTSSDVEDYLVMTGTATLILTMTAGYTADFVSTGVGVLTPVKTLGTSDHIKLSKGKFARTTSAAGSAAIDFGL